MFHGDDADLDSIVRRALATARDLGHPHVGSEHLLLALTLSGSRVANVLALHGGTGAAVKEAVCAAAPSGAGATADRSLLAVLGVDLTGLLNFPGGTSLDHLAGREPVFPLGLGKARKQCARMRPPLGLDAQAVYEASLRLALARRERRHQSEHLALTLVALDPGVHWVLNHIGVDSETLRTDLAAEFPPPDRNPLVRVERKLGHRFRYRDIVRRYQRVTGRRPADSSALAGFIAG